MLTRSMKNKFIEFATLSKNAITAYSYIETGAKQIIISENTTIEEYQKMIQRCDQVLEDIKRHNS